MKIMAVNYIRLITLLILLIFSSTSFSAKFFRWTDENGKTHYSYNLPPSATQQGYTKINQNGRRVEQIQSHESELAEAKAKEATTAAELKKALEAQEAEDEEDPRNQYLLSTYVNVEELTAAHQERVQLIQDQLVVYKSRIKKLEKSLDNAREQLKNSQNQTVSTKLKDYIQVNSDSLAVYEEMIHDNRQQMIDVNKNYEADKQRLSELLSRDTDESNDEETEEVKQ